MSDLDLPALRAQIEPNLCADPWDDRGARVCRTHGFYWPDGNVHCGESSAEAWHAAATLLTALDSIIDGHPHPTA